MGNDSSAKRFIGNTLIFFIGTVLSKMVSFLLMPLYTTKIVSEQMGIFDTSVTLGTMVFSICYFELWSAVLRFLYSKENAEKKSEIIGAGWRIFFVSSAVFIIVCSIMCKVMHYDYGFLVVIYGIASALSNQMTFVARGLGLNKAFSFSGIINTTVHLLFNILLLTVFNIDYSALYISFILGVLAQTIFLQICIHKSGLLVATKNHHDKTLINQMLKYSLPLCFNTVSYWLLTSFNRIVYNRIFGNSASGIFSIGGRFGSLIALATTCFTYAWQDLAFSKASDDIKENAKLYTTACDKYQKFLVSATVLFLPAISLVFPFFVKGEYTDAMRLVPSFILVAIISAYSAFLGNIFYAIKDTKSITISTIISAVFNLAICYPTIKYFGGSGANIATILAFAVNIAYRAIVLNKKLKFSIRIHSIFLSVLWLIVTIFTYHLDNTLLQIGVLVINFVLAILMFRKDIVGILKTRRNNVI